MMAGVMMSSMFGSFLSMLMMMSYVLIKNPPMPILYGYTPQDVAWAICSYAAQHTAQAIKQKLLPNNFDITNNVQIVELTEETETTGSQTLSDKDDNANTVVTTGSNEQFTLQPLPPLQLKTLSSVQAVYNKSQLQL